MAAAHDGETNRFERFSSSASWTISTNKTTAGSDRVAIVTLHSGLAPNTLTYDGVSILGNLLGSGALFGGGINQRMYYVVAPPTAASVIAATFAGPTSGVLGCSSYNGVDQSNPIRDHDGATGSGSTPTITLTGCVAGDMVVDGSCVTNLSDPDGSQTSNYESLGGSDESGSSREAAAGTSVTMSWTGSGNWAIYAACLQAAGGGGGIESGAASMSGVATASFTGASRVQAPFSMAGTGTASFVGRSVAAAVLNAAGIGAFDAANATIASGVFTSSGIATNAYVGASRREATFTMAGVAVLTAVGASTVAGVFNMAGVAAAAFTDAVGGVFKRRGHRSQGQSGYKS
jgi:hypothetical protein